MDSSTTARSRMRRGRGSRLAAAVAGVAAASLILAACGSGDSDSTATEVEAPQEVTEEVEVVEETQASDSNEASDIQALAERVLRTTDVDANTLDPAIQSTFQQALVDLTPEQLDLALECWANLDCQVPGGGNLTMGYISPEVNTWRKVSRMEAILQALTYPEVGRIISVTPEFDLAQMQAGVRSLAADGADLIVGYNDFGAALAPAFKQAQDGGALVSIFVGPAPDAPPGSITTQVTGDVCAIGEEMAEGAAEIVGGSGNIVFFNGTPGNPQGATWNKCAEDFLAANHPDVRVVGKYDTGWTLQGAFEAATAMLASGQDVDLVLYDYADPMPQIVNAYDQAGKATPSMLTWTSNNDLYRVWEEKLGTDGEFILYDTNSINWPARVSVTALMNQIIRGQDAPELVIYPMPFVQAERGLYQPQFPADYPGATLVPESVIERMLGGS